MFKISLPSDGTVEVRAILRFAVVTSENGRVIIPSCPPAYYDWQPRMVRFTVN